MEISTATNSACSAKSMIVRQLQWTSVPVLWCLHCTRVKSSNFAGNDELVAVEDSIDVGNVLYIVYDSLCIEKRKTRAFQINKILNGSPWAKLQDWVPCWTGKIKSCWERLPQSAMQAKDWAGLTVIRLGLQVQSWSIFLINTHYKYSTSFQSTYKQVKYSICQKKSTINSNYFMVPMDQGGNSQGPFSGYRTVLPGECTMWIFGPPPLEGKGKKIGINGAFLLTKTV